MAMTTVDLVDQASAEIRSLLAAIPEDPLVAFVLADYLQDQDDHAVRLRGELLRLVYALTRSAGGPDRAGQEQRLRILLRQGVRPIGPYRRLELDGEVALDFAWVPPGVFLMGSPDGEEGRPRNEEEAQGWRLRPGEGPRHEVILSRGFWMGTTPVTQLQYARVVGRNPSWDSDGSADVEPENRDRPVQEVTWFDAVAFLRRLSKRTGGLTAGARFRLPTEAEWEYACRAGTTTRFWSGNAAADLAWVGWFGANTRGEDSPLQPVGRKPANGFGLHDVHGNVWEWCADLFGEGYYARSPGKDPRCRRGEEGRRVVRGGDAWDDAAACRSAARDSNAADCSHNDISFRVACDRL